MGVIQHHSVLAVTPFEEDLKKIKKWVKTLAKEDRRLFLFSKVMFNGYFTVVCVPDGSKEGWERSQEGAEIRYKFVKRLKTHWEWVEVSFGEWGQEIREGNCKDKYLEE
jgi:hypothetical protein